MSGGIRFFFFGTLMDPDILRTVLGRAIDAPLAEPAWLAGYARFRVRGGSYPIIARLADARVDGQLVHTLGERDVARIGWYESDEYLIAPVTVMGQTSGEIEALCCLPEGHARHDGTPWSLAEWQANGKAGLLAHAETWMAAFTPAAKGRARRASADQPDPAP